MTCPNYLPRYAALLTCLCFISINFLAPAPLFAHHPIENIENIADAEQHMLAVFYETSTLPTKTPQAFDNLPAAMCVITREQIRSIGARDLLDVLHLIPGLQLGIGAIGYPQLTMRGMPSHGAEKLKFMIDGHNVDIALTGGSALFFADYPIDSIQKIEFLRGPGSSLYGSDALLGVINIVTRKKTNHKKTELSARLGSFDTQRYNIESGQTFGPVKLYGSANYLNSNGADVYVEEDALSSSPANSKISNAPGHSNEWVERTTLNLSAETEHLKFQGQFIDHQDGGFFNPGMSLTDQIKIDRNYSWADLSYENTFFKNTINFNTNLSYNRYKHDYDITLQPPGFKNTHYTYTNGMRSITRAIVDELGLTLQADSYFFNHHTITFGSEIKLTDLHDVSTEANYDPAPLPGMQDVSSYFNWMKEEDRLYYGIFLQDQYRYGDALVILVGGRYDRYNDSGSAFSPNLGAAYHFLPDWQFKLLYGQAFRVPSFRELYKLPAGASLQGDPELKAESVKTWQTILEWHASKNMTTSITAYHNDFNNTIAAVTGIDGIYTFANLADGRSMGIDLEIRGKTQVFASGLSWFTIISYIDSRQNDGNKRPGAASWLGTAGFDLSFAEYIKFSTTIHYTGAVYMNQADLRPEPDSYFLVDTALTINNAMGKLHGLDITWSVHNLLDQDYIYPEISGKMPGHFPRPGASTELWLTYHF